MTDGVRAGSLAIGDGNFLTHHKIEPELGEVWKTTKLSRRLGDFAGRVAAELQYELPSEADVLGEREEIVI